MREQYPFGDIGSDCFVNGERGMFKSSEQRICDQERAIRKNRRLTEVDMETIKRRVSEDCIEEEKNEAGMYNELGDRNEQSHNNSVHVEYGDVRLLISAA